ncbi:MAG TPA: hypothetical protein VF017_12045 [Thermoanaerobaculia bacterium]|nr:hypothetical protein [Thermoanaerobaculia bacterium]
MSELSCVLDRLDWLRREGIWPNGLRYLWTDAFGVVLLVSLYRETGSERYLDEAEQLVAEVERVLGRPRGLRIGEAPDRDGQYFHYLAKWLFALDRLGRVRSGYRERAIELARAIHPAFLERGHGVWWKMTEDLSGPYGGYGFGALDAFDGYAVYRLLAPHELRQEITEMAELIETSWQKLAITQDLGLGMMLWLCHLCPDEEWAVAHRYRSLAMLERMWIDPPGYFCRHPLTPEVKFAFTNYGVSLGLQVTEAWPERVARLHRFLSDYRSGDEYDRDAITHVMGMVAHLPGEFRVEPAANRLAAEAAAAPGRGA